MKIQGRHLLQWVGFVIVSCIIFASINLVQGRNVPSFMSASASGGQSIEQLIGKPSGKRIAQHVRAMTTEPHEAGIAANVRTAEYYAKQLREFGFDEVIFNRYEVLLPRPILREVTLLTPERYQLKLTEPPISEDPDSRNQGVLPPFNAYAADGDVTAEVVYVNYGLPADYAVLDWMGISVKGKIAIARYGKSWRGIKSRLAAERGAVGCLIYSDPAEDGFVRGEVIPKGKWRPKFGVQRGSVLDIPTYPGDPQTPMQPSKPGSQRIPLSKAITLEKIPVLPISYGDALPILRNLKGDVAPKEWQGGLPISYHIGDGKETRVYLRLKSDWSVRPIVNVIGILRGREQPEKIVMVGSHRDAWGFGAGDPIGGASSLLESARLIGEQAKLGHRPKRSIAIASWDAEEYGMIGSTEYGEEFKEALQGNLVVYLNREAYSAGDFGAAGVHSLQPFINEITREVQMPSGNKTVFAAWMEWMEKAGKKSLLTPNGVPIVRMGGLGAGSDYVVFLDHLGIPSVDFGFSGGTGSYHSLYDTYWFFTTHGDKDFSYGETLTELVSRFLLRMADAEVLPFDYASTAETINGYLDELAEVAKKLKLADMIDLTGIRAANARLKETALQLNKEIARIKAMDAKELEGNRQALAQLNDLLLATELAFLDPNGLPRRPWYRHQIYAPGYLTGYGVKTLPGVREAMEKKDVEEAKQMAQVLENTLNRVRGTLQEAVTVASGAIAR
jgi:N-acetylated-alpha-linked acidic dipeptidase